MKNIKEYTTEKKLDLKKYFSQFSKKKTLVIVQLNDDPASNAYIRGKLKDCEEISIDARLIKLSEETSQEELLKLVFELNKDTNVDGFIVQMPLPKQIDEEVIKRSILPEKDVDGFNQYSIFTPATPKGIVEFLKDNNFEFKGKNAVILGRSNIVGKPMHDILLKLDMNVINLHTKTTEDDKKFYIEHADLIIVSIGRKYNVDNRYNFKKDCIVFDVGINREDGKLYGDCVPDLKVRYQSPVPGGVGLLTRLALLINLKEVCEKMEFNIKNTNVYGMDYTLKASGNPMRTEFDRSEVNEKDIIRAEKLGTCLSGQGHDNFLKGIIVQFDVTAPLFWWKEAQRYHWLDFISSQSTMHCLLKFDVEKQCVSDTNKQVLEIVSKIKDEYNSIPEEDVEKKKEKWRELVASTPCGFCLGASMTTNYQQLKTIFNQRKNHKLKEWHVFCDWCLTLPKFSEFTGCKK